jgi:hypothetical protein
MILNEGDADEVKSHLLELVPEYIGSTPVPMTTERDGAQVRGAHA